MHTRLLRHVMTFTPRNSDERRALAERLALALLEIPPTSSRVELAETTATIHSRLIERFMRAKASEAEATAHADEIFGIANALIEKRRRRANELGTIKA